MSQKTEMAACGNENVSPYDVRELDRSLFVGFAWTVMFRWIAQAISWVSTFYVARILTPADYGLVAMAMVPIGLARLVEDLGLDAVIVQDRTLANEQLAKLAGSAVCLGVVLTTLFNALSVPVSIYFREPAVAAILSILSFMFLADSLQVLPRALLQRNLQFRTLAWLHGLQVITGAAAAAVCATFALGHWSLVLSILLSSVVVTIVLYVLQPFRLAWPREIKKLARSFLAGWHMMASRALWYGYSNLDSTLIGRALGKEALGAFGFSMTFASLPVTELTSMLSKVVPGVFSTISRSQPVLRRYFLMLTEAVSYLTLPISFGVGLTADDVVLLALGEQWYAVIMPLRILCIYMAINSCQMLFSHVLLWTGHFRANMWLNCFALVVLLASFYVGLTYGITGVAWGWVIGFPLSLVPNWILLRRILALPLSAYLNALRPALFSCIIMSVAVLLIRQVLLPDWPHLARLVVQSSAGAVTYALVMLLLFRSEVVNIYQAIREAYQVAGVSGQPIYQH